MSNAQRKTRSEALLSCSILPPICNVSPELTMQKQRCGRDSYLRVGVPPTGFGRCPFGPAERRGSEVGTKKGSRMRGAYQIVGLSRGPSMNVHIVFALGCWQGPSGALQYGGRLELARWPGALRVDMCRWGGKRGGKFYRIASRGRAINAASLRGRLQANRVAREGGSSYYFRGRVGPVFACGFWLR